MKTSKLLTIVSVATIAVMSLSITSGVIAKQILKEQKVIQKSSHMNFEQAVQNPGILKAMYEQIENNFMPPLEHFYIAQVSYRGSKLYIAGTFEQWYFFFKDQLIYRKTHQQ